MSYRILLVGGGSGGHVYPLVAVADALREKAQREGVVLELLLLGEGGFVEQAAKDDNIAFKSIFAGKLRRYFSLLTFLDIFKIPIGFFQSLGYVFWFMPDVVFSKGGYASVAPVLVSKLYFIPVFVHESDSVPGLANKLMGKLAAKIFISFRDTAQYFKTEKCLLVGNPVRKSLLTGDRQAGIKLFNLNENLKTILVLGGSQGAQKINEVILNSLVMLAKEFQIIHQCGESQLQFVKNEANRIIKEGEGRYDTTISKNYKLFPFFNEHQLSQAYAACDLVVSRAGAGSLAEISMIGKPAIVIPLPTTASRGEQIANAEEFAKMGAVMIEEENLTRHILINQIELLLEPAKYNEVSQKIKSFALLDAADKIAEALLQPR